jgi:hypothetical protein
MRALALTLLGFALRLLHLSTLGDLEFDEIVSVRYAALAPDELLRRLSAAVFEHPPLFYLLLGGWRGLAGGSDMLARFLSILPGTLTIPLVYAAGRRLFGARAGLVAALLVAVSPLPVFYSREVRMYGLVACLALASFWLCLRALGRPRGAGNWAAYGLLAGGAALVHYAGLLVLLAQPAVVLLAGGTARHRLRPLLVAAGVVALGAAAWALGSSGVRESLPALDARNLAAVPGALWHAWRELAGGPELPGWWTLFSGLALAALVVLGMTRRGAGTSLLRTSFCAGLLALVIAVVLGKPVQARYLLPASSFVYLLAAGAMMRRPGPGAVLLGVTLCFGALPFWATYYGSYRRADYSDITSRIATLERSDDAILLTGPWQAWYFDYYYPQGGGQLLHRVLPENAPPALEPAQARRELEDFTGARRRLWFVQAGLAQADPTNFVERWLRQHAWPALREAHQNAVLSLYALQAPEVKRALRPMEFGGAIRLAGGWVDGDEIPAADVARLWLEFETLHPLEGSYKASLRVVGADGQRVTTDFELSDVNDGRPAATWRPGERVGIRRGVWLPVSTNPQPYDLRLVVYDGATLTPLEPKAMDGAPLSAGAGGEAPVGGLYVTQSRAKLPPPPDTVAPVGRSFGGGDEFDTITLAGVRWHQDDPSAGPLLFDLLWRVGGTSGTAHESRVSVVDAGGNVWLDEARPLFSGAFNMHDWRDAETLGERRALDFSSLPAGRYTMAVRLIDARGRQLPVDGEVGQAQLLSVQLPYERPISQRVAGVTRRVTDLATRLWPWH